jgi:single-strand DNA-binding protein
MPNFAQITLIGHLTKDAETAFTGQGTAITRFDLAVNTGFGNNKQVTFYRCAFFGERGQKVAQYLTKGKPVLVTGEPSLRKTTRDDGRAFTDLTVNVRELTLLGGNQAQSPQGQSSDNGPDDDQVPF